MKQQIIVLSVLCMLTACKESGSQTTGTNADTAALINNREVPAGIKEQTGWDSINFASPIVKYDNITSRDIEVREGGNYAVYGIIDEVLFNSGKSELRNDAENTLILVCRSINAKFPHNKVRVYGYTDAMGDTAENVELSLERAQKVKHFLYSNCGIDSTQITVTGEGEKNPVADNTSKQGRRQNRRVRVVVRK